MLTGTVLVCVMGLTLFSGAHGMRGAGFGVPAQPNGMHRTAPSESFFVQRKACVLRNSHLARAVSRSQLVLTGTVLVCVIVVQGGGEVQLLP